VGGGTRRATTMFNVLLAWTWGGHGELTTIGLAIAIARLTASGHPALLKKLSEFARTARGGLPKRWVPGEKAVEAEVATIEQHPAATAEQDLSVLLAPLPRLVQLEDIHPANLHIIGRFLEQAQTRHFMRSKRSTPAIVAYNRSRAYIRDHLNEAYSRMREAVNATPHWYSAGTPLTTFRQGMSQLAAALHTIQDSYSPAHVERLEGLWFITDIKVYDSENIKGDVAHAIPNHDDYDNPSTPKSLPFYQEAKRTTGDFIDCVLSNLDQSPQEFTRVCGNLLESHFSVVLTSKMN
jgi:hypothetical protein